MLERGNKRILLNFRKVRYLDSSGLGELVKMHVTVQRQGGQLKMSNLDQRLLNLLKATSLYKVFDVYEDEDTAVQSFGRLDHQGGRRTSQGQGICGPKFNYGSGIANMVNCAGLER
jgi:MFS superfamily sulfate permease-like transporter